MRTNESFANIVRHLSCNYWHLFWECNVFVYIYKHNLFSILKHIQLPQEIEAHLIKIGLQSKKTPHSVNLDLDMFDDDTNDNETKEAINHENVLPSSIEQKLKKFDNGNINRKKHIPYLNSTDMVQGIYDFLFLFVLSTRYNKKHNSETKFYLFDFGNNENQNWRKWMILMFNCRDFSFFCYQ